MRMKIINFIFPVLLIIIMMTAPLQAQAVECGVIPQSICNQVVQNPDATPAGAIMPLVNFFLNIMVGLFGSIIVLIIIASAVQITVSAGNEESIKKAKENIFKAVTGLVLLISFRAVAELINRVFSGVQTNVLFVGDQLAPEGIPKLIGNITSLASFFVGVGAVIFVIIGGIQYVTSAGNPDGIKKAKRTITFALAGLVIAISAYGILLFIQTQLQK